MVWAKEIMMERPAIPTSKRRLEVSTCDATILLTSRNHNTNNSFHSNFAENHDSGSPNLSESMLQHISKRARFTEQINVGKEQQHQSFDDFDDCSIMTSEDEADSSSAPLRNRMVGEQYDFPHLTPRTFFHQSDSAQSSSMSTSSFLDGENNRKRLQLNAKSSSFSSTKTDRSYSDRSSDETILTGSLTRRQLSNAEGSDTIQPSTTLSTTTPTLQQPNSYHPHHQSLDEEQKTAEQLMEERRQRDELYPNNRMENLTHCIEDWSLLERNPRRIRRRDNIYATPAYVAPTTVIARRLDDESPGLSSVNGSDEMNAELGPLSSEPEGPAPEPNHSFFHS